MYECHHTWQKNPKLLKYIKRLFPTNHNLISSSFLKTYYNLLIISSSTSNLWIDSLNNWAYTVALRMWHIPLDPMFMLKKGNLEYNYTHLGREKKKKKKNTRFEKQLKHMLRHHKGMGFALYQDKSFLSWSFPFSYIITLLGVNSEKNRGWGVILSEVQSSTIPYMKSPSSDVESQLINFKRKNEKKKSIW